MTRGGAGTAVLGLGAVARVKVGAFVVVASLTTGGAVVTGTARKNDVALCANIRFGM